MKKTAATILLGATLVAGGGFAADAQINPYTERNNNYELPLIAHERNEGESKVVIHRSEPKVTISKWSGEANLSIKYTGVNSSGSRALLTDKVEWKEGKTEVHAYPVTLDKGKKVEKSFSPINKVEAQTVDLEEAFEFEVVWNEPPATTTLNFEFEGWENYDFYHQPPLTEDEVALGTIRPDNIINSFAVYHKTKANHREGGINYSTGKVGHIYRLKAIDANRNEKWIDDVAYSNGVLTATVDPAWVATAAYPITVDPTFGFSTIGASQTGLSFNTWYAISANAPENGTVTAVSAWFNAGSAGRSMKGVIANSSLNIITDGVGTAVLLTTTPATLATSVISNASITNGSQYYIGIIVNSTNVNGYYDNVAGQGFQHANDFTTPTNPTTASSNSNRWSNYATYTAAGGTPPSGEGYIINFE